MLFLAQPLLRRQCVWLCAAETPSLWVILCASSKLNTLCGAVVGTLTEVPAAESAEGSQGVGGMPMGSEALVQAANSEHLFSRGSCAPSDLLYLKLL